MEEILRQLKIKADVVGSEWNGIVAKYLLKLHSGTKLEKLERYATEIALGMKSYGKPIIKPITEEGVVSVEFIIHQQGTIPINSLYEELTNSKLKLPIIVGRTVFGENLTIDLTSLPHLLVAGSTGSGKSIFLHSAILSLIRSKRDVSIILVDPKTVEFGAYNNIKQLLCNVINSPEEALTVLSDLINEMNSRFSLLARKKVTNIVEYNSKTLERLSYVVLIVDEFSDLMYNSKKEFQKLLCVLSQKCRAAGIHIIMSTQRPSTDIINGSIKTNFPARISFRVPSSYDSRVVLNEVGADRLLGDGDGLIISPKHNLVRFKGAFVASKDINKVVAENNLNWFQRLIRTKWNGQI